MPRLWPRIGEVQIDAIDLMRGKELRQTRRVKDEQADIRQPPLCRLACREVKHTLLRLEPDVIHLEMTCRKLRQEVPLADTDLHVKGRTSSELLRPVPGRPCPVPAERRDKRRIVQNRRVNPRLSPQSHIPSRSV